MKVSAKRLVWTLGLILSTGSATAWAQQPTDGGGPLERFFFDPEFVMQNQRHLDLTESQREAIKKEAVAAQTRFVALQWDLQEAMQRMREIVEAEHIDEAAALEALDRVLDLEREVKRTQLILGIRIRNALTPEQRRTLFRLRRAKRNGAARDN